MARRRSSGPPKRIWVMFDRVDDEVCVFATAREARAELAWWRKEARREGWSLNVAEPICYVLAEGKRNGRKG